MTSPDAPKKTEEKTSKASPQRGKRVYSEVEDRKARKARLMMWLTRLLEGLGALVTAIILVVLFFMIFDVPIYFQIAAVILAIVFLYWALSESIESVHLRKSLKPLSVYELGLRPPCGSKQDMNRGRPPRFVKFEDTEAFFANEGEVNLPYFAVLPKDPDADPIVVPKKLVGDWDRFKDAIEDKMAVRNRWVFLKGEGAMFAGCIESDDLHIDIGPATEKRKLSWDNVSAVPTIKHKAHKSLVVLVLVLRKGGEIKFLIPFEDADAAVKNFGRYVERFWKTPEDEEERWEKVEEVE